MQATTKTSGLVRWRRFLAGVVVSGSALFLSGCGHEGSLSSPKHMKPVSPELRALMDEKDMERSAPVLMRLYKADAKLEVWKKQRKTGQYALLKSFDICRWSGDLGPKVSEGDRQAPEGIYTITPGLMNPKSSYHLAFNTGFPNAFDRAHGRYGSHLMVHGDCTSRGCYAMTNQQVEDIYALARDAFDGGQKGVQLQLFPFRMSAQNMYRYRKNAHYAFWKNLKEGADHFEVTHQEPQVAVCSKRYVFNQTPLKGGSFVPDAACPAAQTPHAVAQAVQDRSKRDEAMMALLAQKEHEPKSALLAGLSGGTSAKANAPPHRLYVSRTQVRSTLPMSSPEALSLLPGVEAGPTPELRKIAKGEMQGQPLDEELTASVAPVVSQQAASGAVASVKSAPVPAPSPLKPAMIEPAVVAHASVSSAPAASQGWFSRMLSSPKLEQPAQPAASAPSLSSAGASSSLSSGVPAKALPTPQPSPLRGVVQAVKLAPPLDTSDLSRQ